MRKRKTYVIKKDILMAIRDKPMSYAELERKLDTGYRTIVNHCEELSAFGGTVAIERIDKHPSNGRESYRVRLTEQGKYALRKLQ